ncbi:hypothetical protein BHE74_00012568 [Ensete ventricosum]|nr:hypothetical protein GW17_00002301 [Ensete ventricosum]RWW79156.1 hypothetical protein BHE74_00012568 [Ensete ventricosum]
MFLSRGLFLCAGYMFSLNHARFLILMATAYAVYCVNAHIGLHGVLLSLNISFISNDILNKLLQGYDGNGKGIHVKEQKEPEQVTEGFPFDSEYSPLTKETEDVMYSKSSCTTPKASNTSNTQKDASSSKVNIVDLTSLVEIQRIMNSLNHYEVLGFLRNKNVDPNILKKEYHKKVCNLVAGTRTAHYRAVPPKINRQWSILIVGGRLREKSTADGRLREKSTIGGRLSEKKERRRRRGKEEKKKRGEEERIPSFHAPSSPACRRHPWVASARAPSSLVRHSHPRVASAHVPSSLARRRHPRVASAHAPLPLVVSYWYRDELGILVRIDCEGRTSFSGLLKYHELLYVQRAKYLTCPSGLFVRSYMGMACRPDTHGPTFHVNMVGLDKTGLRSNSSRYPWGLDAEMIDEDDEFELWLQQALASGIFSETRKHRKSWPFKIHQKSMRPWRKLP